MGGPCLPVFSSLCVCVYCVWACAYVLVQCGRTALVMVQNLSLVDNTGTIT